MLEGNPTTLPDTWDGPAGLYTLTVDGADSWRVVLGREAIGTLVEVPEPNGSRWTIRMAGNDVAGVGSSWASWEEALTDLAEFRAGVAS